MPYPRLAPRMCSHKLEPARAPTVRLFVPPQPLVYRDGRLAGVAHLHGEPYANSVCVSLLSARVGQLKEGGEQVGDAEVQAEGLMDEGEEHEDSGGVVQGRVRLLRGQLRIRVRLRGPVHPCISGGYR